MLKNCGHPDTPLKNLAIDSHGVSATLPPSLACRPPAEIGVAWTIDSRCRPLAQVSAKAGATVRQLAVEAEEQILGRHGLRVATALVLCPARDSALPLYDTAADYVGAEVRCWWEGGGVGGAPV